MPNETTKNLPQDKSLGIGRSDDFVLPIAPPAPPPPSRATSATTSESGRSSEPPSPESSHPSLPISSGSTIDDLLPVHGTTESQTVDNSGEDSDASDSSNKEQATSSSLVVGLICAVVVLLVVIIIQFNQTSDHEPPPVLSSSGNDRVLAAARNEVKAARNEIAHGERKIRDLEEQLAASRGAMAEKVASLIEENKRLEKLSSDLSSETARLKSQIETATRPTTLAESLPPAQRTPVAQDGQIYRVAGLRPGDTLNIRSGPGTNYPTITALQNGVRVTVTGAAVMNGPDAWLPCIISLNMVDPATGYSRSWNQKCWINSFFLEQVQDSGEP